MVRSGTWKLIYTHGHVPQLFDLATDPHERQDLAADPAYAELRASLEARVLDGWDPDAIAATIAARRQDKDVIDAWARHVRPPDEFRWILPPEQNRLEAADS
jgi:choline-sulfatase